jgi:hypothetical protein
MAVPFGSIRTVIGPSITRPTGMMQSQALATLVIIRQIVRPASDLAHSLPESSFSSIAAFIGIAQKA